MSRSSTIVCGIAVMATSAALAGCATGGSRPSSTAAGPPTYEEAQAAAEKAAQAARERSRGMTFEQFEAATYKEPFPGGKYIVNGDTPIVDFQHLREFFEKQVQQEPAPVAGSLIVNQVGGLDTIWNSTEKYTLTYCVSTEFGTAPRPGRHRHRRGDPGLGDRSPTSATRTSRRRTRTARRSNKNVVFDVRPVNVERPVPRARVLPQQPRSTPQRAHRQHGVRLHPRHAAAHRHPSPRARPHPRLPPRAHPPRGRHLLRGQQLARADDVRPASVMHYPQCNGTRRLEPYPHRQRQDGCRLPLRAGPGLQRQPGRLPGREAPRRLRGRRPARLSRRASRTSRWARARRSPTDRSRSPPARSSRRT